MALHPRERPGYDRRRFLRNSLLASAGAFAGPGLLSACSQPEVTASAATPLPMARPEEPVELPIPDEVSAIADGMEPETGTLKIFNYADYLAPGVVKAFGKEYGVDVEVTTFNSMDEAVAKLRTGQARFDVFFPTPDVLAKVVLGGLLQPINHSYLPNLTNAWSQLQDPFYDRGARYTVPYNVYSTGIGYRADEAPTVPTMGYDACWDPEFAGKVHILDDGREAIGMSLLRNNLTTNVNTEDPELLRSAGDALSKLVPAVQVKVDISAYTEVPENRATIHQCWSGDMISAQYYLPKGVSADVLGYWVSADRPVIGSDTIAVVAGAEHPVLAHHFMNHLLDQKVALRNFGWVGYQPVLEKFTPEFLFGQEYVPENLQSAVVTAEQYDAGVQLLQLSADGRVVWDDVWATFKSG